MLPVPSIKTSRLVLRDWRDDDFPAFRALNLDREVRRYFPNVLMPYESDALAKKLRDRLQTNGWGFWAVELVAESRFIGFVGLDRPSFAPFASQVELGWRLSRDVWGRGYATEAAEAAVTFGFTTLGLRELIAFTVPSNLPSRRVMQKLGMQRDEAADFLHPNVADGHELKPHVLYRLSYESWQRRRAALSI